MGFERPEIQRDIRHRCRQDAPRGAARQIAFEDVALGHAAAEFVDQLPRGDAGRRELDTRIPHSSRHREGAQTFAPVAALASEPLRPLLDDVAHPEERLDIVAQGRSAEEPDLRRERRTLARQAAFALNAFEHRRFFTADISAGAAAQVDARMARQRRPLYRRDLAFKDRAALWVLVAQIDICLCRLDDPGSDQHPFEKAMRVGLKEVPVLERTGLAFVAIDREQARRRFLQYQAPLPPGRKPGAAETTQAGVLEDLDQFFGLAFAGQAGLEQAIPAGRTIGSEPGVFWKRRILPADIDCGGDIVDRRMLVQCVADRDDRSAMAPAHAGCPDDSYTVSKAPAQSLKQLSGTGQLAAQAVANAHGQRRRWRLLLHNDVEMRVE